MNWPFLAILAFFAIFIFVDLKSLITEKLKALKGTGGRKFLPPESIASRDRTVKYVFLAGSIEMGKAKDWQKEMEDFFEKEGWGTFNPRRKDWDSSWEQSIEDPQFYQQVSWELDGLEKADMVLLYLEPDTKSPISLLELGKFSIPGKTFVVCPDGFWRKGNVDIFCVKYNIPVFESLEKFKDYFIEDK